MRILEMVIAVVVLAAAVLYCALRSKEWSKWMQRDFARNTKDVYGDGTNWYSSWNRYIFQAGVIFVSTVIAITIFFVLFPAQ